MTVLRVEEEDQGHDHRISDDGEPEPTGAETAGNTHTEVTASEGTSSHESGGAPADRAESGKVDDGSSVDQE